MASGQPDWSLRECGPADADTTVLLLPGGLCTAVFYDELTAQPQLSGLRLVAATLPGHGGTPPPADVSVEYTANLVADLAEAVGAHVVVGFSMGANVALEMAAAGRFAGPVVLLAPSFSTHDERFLVTLDRLGRVLGRLPFAAMLPMMSVALRSSGLPAQRQAVLRAEFGRNDPRVMRRLIRSYLSYLRHHGSLAPRLAGAEVPAWVVHAEHGDGGISADERGTLAALPHIRVVTIPGTSFFLPNEKPALTADLLLEAVAVARTAR